MYSKIKTHYIHSNCFIPLLLDCLSSEKITRSLLQQTNEMSVQHVQTFITDADAHEGLTTLLIWLM